ncbi:MAG: isoleucine--tRNA ligase [Anaerolineaceae bacterium]|nr:isoleucine--tRNA ligase [Anaerolineaceae bacterium]
MFKSVSPKLNVIQMEAGVLKFWQENDIFHKSGEQREGNSEFVFYEGPPTANGRPGVHHVLARAFKDIFPRYKTMQGFHVSRRGGWDTQGLPVEIEIEKKLGLNGKQQIEAYGIDKFNAMCRESAFEYIQEWEKLTDRIGFWVDLETAYVTYKNEYIESIWWILKNFWDKDLLYEGYKVLPYCPRCGTPLSDHEVAQGYQDVDDPSIFIRMKLIDQPDTSLLVWTTTPWTLPGNVAVAAHPEVDYVLLERALNHHDEDENCEDCGNHKHRMEKLIMAGALVEKVFGEEEIKILKHMKGTDLAGMQYEPLFHFFESDKPGWFVVLGEHVTTEDGTGLVHTAPAFGAEDMLMAQEHNLPILMTIDDDGKFLPEVTPWAGIFVKDADPGITNNLNERGLLFRSGTINHTYPFCWRCKTPLLYTARPTWYIRTTSKKERMLELNDKINWYPDHIKNGRFGNWLKNNIDWALGRNRYWGTPLPVWRCEDCGHKTAIGSAEELGKKAGQNLSELDLHRPYVDDIHFACEKCGGTMNRVTEVIDCWADSGSMPYAQWHYPFENEEMFKKQYPADFICEAVDQTRGWFYTLHALSTLLFDQQCFKNVICLGLILDSDGYKMSKSRGNIVNPWDVLDTSGADAMRWYLYTASPPGQSRRFSPQLVANVVRSFTLTLWNTYSFFVTYANLDKWKPDSDVTPKYSPLDQWVRSRLHTLLRDVTHALENYDVLGATRPVEGFVNDLSNWYLRRSRRRFWKSESDSDKHAAYATLYEALLTLSQILAPTMPFIAEELYQNLVRTVDENAPESVHLTHWPKVDEAAINETLNWEMALTMKLASLGHAARNSASIKVRQPLAEAAFAVGSAEEAPVVNKYADVLMDELNVKNVRALSGSSEAASFKLNPYPKQLGQKYKNLFPKVRKAILALDSEATAQVFLAGESITIEVDGETYEILPEEVEVRMQAKEGLVMATEGAYLAALDTELTFELEQEGHMRNMLRMLQDARKNEGYEISNRIKIGYDPSGNENVAGTISTYKNTMMEETLAVSLEPATYNAEETNWSYEYEGVKFKIELASEEES